MKKFLALLAALSLMVFAGSAFAGISTNPAAVNVTAGETASATVNASPSHEGGQLGTISFSGPDWAKFDGTSTITLAPDASETPGQYTVLFSVTEDYIGSDANGHVGVMQQIHEVSMTVNVTAPVLQLTFSVTPSTATIMAGETVTITLGSTGGTGTKSFSIAPSAPAVDGLALEGSTATFTPKAAGEYILEFLVTDQAGKTQTGVASITVAEVFAANAEISKNPVSVDEQVSITLKATGGIGAANFFTSTEGVTLGATTDNTATATFSSAESGIFTLSFTALDTAAHTATVKVSVYVDAPEPEPEDEDVVNDVTTDSKDETVTAIVYTLSSDLVKKIDVETINATISQKASAAILSGDYSDEEKAMIGNIDETIKQVTALLFEGANSAEDITITVVENAEEKVAQSDTNAGRSGSAPIMGFTVSSASGGTAAFPLPRQEQSLWGLILRIIMEEVMGVNFNGSSLRIFFAADDGSTSSTVFVDSNGNVTTMIPTSTDVNGNPRIGGFMTMLAYVEPGKNYDMIISIPVEELETAGIETDKTETEVTLPTPFLASGTGFFSTFVSADLLTNTNYYRIGENVLTSKLNDAVVNSDWKRTEEELALATTNNYTMITRLASIDAYAEEDNHTYIVAAVFSADQAKKDRIDTTEDGGFIFYPNGPAEAAAAHEVLKLVARDDGTYGFDDLTPADIKNGVTNGYLTFTINGGEAAVKPMLAVKLLPAQVPTFAFTLTKTSVTVKRGETETAEITPVNNSGDVEYTADEDGEELGWITINGNIVTFAPTAETAARTYTVTISGIDEASAVYSQDITVVVTDGSTPPDDTALRLTASSSTLNLRIGQTETVTLTASNLLGTPTYTAAADKEGAGVTINDNVVTVTPTAAGTYTVSCSVTDSGRTTASTASTSFTVNVSAGGDPGKSGGGCDAGFTALALAVLGGFIAARKK